MDILHRFGTQSTRGGMGLERLSAWQVLVPLSLVLICLAAGTADAADDCVSMPAGFVRLQIPSNSSRLVSLPFVPSDDSLSAVFSNQLLGAAGEAAADRILLWDQEGQLYVTSFKADETGDGARDGCWFESGTNWVPSTQSLGVGEGFWIQNRHDGQVVYLCGAVAFADTQTVSLLHGLNLFGYPFSSRRALNDSDLVADGAYGETNAAWADMVKDAFGNEYWLLEQEGHQYDGNWLDGTGSPIARLLGMGEGFWFDRLPTNTLWWSEARPYADLFYGDTNAPEIVSLLVDTNQQSMTLVVCCSGSAGETIEIFYKDLESTNAFVSGSGWLVADENIATTGETSFAWTDAGSGSRAAITGVFCRVYLISRQDMDGDGDALSDAREVFVHQTDETDADTDNDALDDGSEINTYNTDPNDADSDADGMLDGIEVQWAQDPADSNAFQSLPWASGFETGEGYTAGDVDGQDGWRVLEGGAVVQAATVSTGAQALELGHDTALVSRVEHFCVGPTGAVVWTDMKVRMIPAPLPNMSAKTNHISAAVAVGMNRKLAGYDGVSNAWIDANDPYDADMDQWLHLSVKRDYAARTWNLYRDGLPILRELGFVDASVDRLARLALEGGSTTAGYLDELALSENIPTHIDDDADGLPNVYEDLNTNGVVDAGETDAFDADTDGDGMDDGTELIWGNSSTTSNSYSILPWSTGFEGHEGYSNGSLNDQESWIATTTVTVQADEQYVGTNAVCMTGIADAEVAIEQFFGAQGEADIWFETYARLSPGTLPDVAGIGGSNSVLVGVDEEGLLCAYYSDSESWVATASDYETDPDTWIRLTFNMDYVYGTWSMYIDGDRVFHEVPFLDDSVHAFSRAKIYTPSGTEVAGDVYVDAMSATATEPAGLDNDLDGMPNSWERQYGLDPEDADDRLGDEDGDSLSNLEEYLAGSHPFLWDTDGDGVSDGTEVFETGTDPLLVDITNIVTIAHYDGVDTTELLGSWATNGTSVYATGLRGEIAYDLDIPMEGVFRLEIDGCMHAPLSRTNLCDLLVYVDGEYLGRSTLRTVWKSNAVIHVVMPWLPQGQHSLRLFWDNVSVSQRIQIDGINIQALLGPDTDGNGRQDWIDKRLLAQCAIDRMPDSSLVSPVCIEGRDPYTGMLTVSGALPKRGILDRWYADVPLFPNDTNRVAVAFQNGAVAVTNHIAWSPLNVITAGDMMVRKGDSLRLLAWRPGATNGAFFISIDDGDDYEVTNGIPVIHTFESGGVFNMVGIHDDGITSSNNVTVTVVDAAFGDDPRCWVGRTREWPCAGIPEEVVLEPDPRLAATELGPMPGGGRGLSLVIDEPEERVIVARLGVDGPILASAIAQGFNLHSSGQVFIRVAEYLPDGSKLVEMGHVLTPLLSNLNMDLRIKVGGVTFDDGALEKRLTASDMDQTGFCVVRFVMTPGVLTSTCHTLQVFQNNQFVGER